MTLTPYLTFSVFKIVIALERFQRSYTQTDTLAVIDAVRQASESAHTQHSLLLGLDPDSLVVTGSNRFIQYLGTASDELFT